MNKIISLPEPDTSVGMPLNKAISERRSERHYIQKSLSRKQVGQLLWAAQGITDASRGFRAAPSAGALYPIEIYAVSVEGIDRYVPEGHKIERLSDRDKRKALAKAALGQSGVVQAPLDIVITAVYDRITPKYGKRGIRYAAIEAGHIAQNVHLEAVSMGLGSVPIGAFSDREVAKVLSLPEGEEPLYIIPIGYTQ